MADLDTIQTGIETVLDTISGLQAHSEWPDQVNPPTAWPMVADVAYGQTLGGDDAIMVFNIFCMVTQGGGVERSQKALNDYVSSTGAKSIYKTLWDDGNLNGTVSGILSINLASYGQHDMGGVEFTGAVWRVEVWAE